MLCASKTISAYTSYKLCPVLERYYTKSTVFVLQLLHFWLSRENHANGKIHDGRQWIFNSYEDWRLQLENNKQYLSRITIRRAFDTLEKSGVVLSHCFDNPFNTPKTNQFGQTKINQIKSYTIDYDRLEEIVGDIQLTLLIKRPRPIGEQHTPRVNRAGDKPSFNPTIIDKNIINVDQMSTVPDQMSIGLNILSKKPSKKPFLWESQSPFSPQQTSKNIAFVEEEKKENLTIYEEMIHCWNSVIQQIPHKVKLNNKRTHLLKSALNAYFDNDLSKWESYCHKIASSLFLMGEKQGYSWRINFDWALNPSKVEKILNNEYTFGDRSVPTKYPAQSIKNTNILVESSEAEILRKRLKQTLKEQHLGSNVEYAAWFSDTRIEREERDGEYFTILYVKTQKAYEAIPHRFSDLYDTFFNEIRLDLPTSVAFSVEFSPVNVDLHLENNTVLISHMPALFDQAEGLLSQEHSTETILPSVIKPKASMDTSLDSKEATLFEGHYNASFSKDMACDNILFHDSLTKEHAVSSQKIDNEAIEPIITIEKEERGALSILTASSKQPRQKPLNKVIKQTDAIDDDKPRFVGIQTKNKERMLSLPIEAYSNNNKNIPFMRQPKSPLSLAVKPPWISILFLKHSSIIINVYTNDLILLFITKRISFFERNTARIRDGTNITLPAWTYCFGFY